MAAEFLHLSQCRAAQLRIVFILCPTLDNGAIRICRANATSRISGCKVRALS